jgi:hypothetical protein
MEAKQPDVMAILKLYELRRDEKMRAARAWFFTQFNPESAADIGKLMLSGEAASAYYRMLTSYWEMAASFVNNGGIDEKMFLDANTEHLGVFAKLEPFVTEIREVFGETNYLVQLETLVMKVPHAKQLMAGRRKLFASWAKGQQ